jgi:two-component sensor histidine kinase
MALIHEASPRDTTLVSITSDARCTVLPPSATSPLAAREFTRETLDAWRIPMAYEVLLVVNEMVTNAVIHTTGPVSLVLDLRDGTIRVAVSDDSSARPVKHVSDPPQSGRGLILVAAMSRDWGVREHDGGKLVWADVAIERG